MSNNLRKEALSAFKNLHRTCLKTFHGDDYALKLTRQRINNEFQKNKNLADEATILECIKLAKDVEHEIRTTVIRCEQKSPGLYEAKITEDTVKVNNADTSKLFSNSEFKKTNKCCGSGSPKKMN